MSQTQAAPTETSECDSHPPQQASMIRYRPFRNTDPPALAHIWRTQPHQRGLAQPMSVTLLERFVFSKLYFDPHGLIVAEGPEGPVGFVHAGFGPNDEGTGLSHELGVTCQLMVQPHPQQETIARELLSQGEDYLRRSGASLLYAGCIAPLNPFYLGLYGGSELPGVLASDQKSLALYQAAGYQEIDRCHVLQRRLAEMRPVIDRRQVRLRRQYRLESMWDPPPESWWDANLYSQIERTRLELVTSQGDPPAAWVDAWDLEPLASSWGVHAVGLMNLRVDDENRRQGMATYLMCEALKLLSTQGATLCEVQVMRQNDAAVSLYQKLGFQQVDEGIVLRKQA